MADSDPFRAYLQELRRSLATDMATERSHYPALKALLEAVGDGVSAINEPSRIACGAPDFIITRAHTPVGYVEAKDVGVSLDAAERSEQVRRYRAALNNLILTDYLQFRWYVEGEHRETVRLATLTASGEIRRATGDVRAVGDLLQRFFACEVPTVGRSRELAERMAALARMTHDLIEETFRKEGKEGRLHAQSKAFRETLIPDLTPARFADMYAQTIAYGLFAARVCVDEGGAFTRERAAWNLPRTNPFLRSLFSEIAGPDLDERIAWLVDDLAHLLARADMAEILRDFGQRAHQQDPVVHFYETFLAAYDPQMRQRRGVYYTPEPVVAYIVHSVEHLLRTRFGCPWGLADKDRGVYVLDPAAGTATFLYFVIRQIHETLTARGQAGGWSDYVEKHLLPRLFGFELLMAPYAVAHMKLGILLQETGYDFSGDQRLGIYLTNTLEEAVTCAETLGFAGFITDEANAAAEVKREKPILVVLGNPPYSVSSANREEKVVVDQEGKRRKVKTHIGRLMEDYKRAVRGERNIQPLSDDYIKFIRFAHDRIERTGHGVVGMITNHTYLSGLIHRGMREELIKSFDEIYLLNLHGSALLGEAAPNGGKDENVFDIRQGVAIGLFVKRPSPQAGRGGRVYYADLWGAREGKYRYMAENDVTTTEWQELEPVAPHFFFVPKDFDLLSEYEQGWSVADIFPVNSSGIKTHRDHFVIDFEEERLHSRIAEFRDTAFSDGEVKERFRLRDTRDWKISEARAQLCAREDWEKDSRYCLYRPFDVRPIYYSGDVIDRPRREVMRHMLLENVCLIANRQIKTEGIHHFLAANLLADFHVLETAHASMTVFPLYLYPPKKKSPQGGGAVNLTLFEPQEEYTARRPNLSPAFVAALAEKLRLEFIPDGQGDLESAFGPEDVFHYIYAILHCPTYRQRYAELLRIDFPRVPLTSDRALFAALAEKGKELVTLHLMETSKLNGLVTHFPVADSNVVERVRYVEPTAVEGDDAPLPRAGSSRRQLALFGGKEPAEPERRPGPRPAGRVYINETQYFEGIAPDVWAFQIGGYQVLHKWLKDRKGRKLTFDDLLHYQRVVVALKETMRLMVEIDRLTPAWPIE